MRPVDIPRVQPEIIDPANPADHQLLTLDLADAIDRTGRETPTSSRPGQAEFMRRAAEATPMGRPGTAEDIVGPAIFLASDLSSYVSGSIVMVDGGYRAV